MSTRTLRQPGSPPPRTSPPPLWPGRYVGSRRQFATVTQPNGSEHWRPPLKWIRSITVCRGERGRAVRPNASEMGTWMGAANPGHPTPWKLYWYHHRSVLWAKLWSSLFEEGSGVFLLWLLGSWLSSIFAIPIPNSSLSFFKRRYIRYSSS